MYVSLLKSPSRIESFAKKQLVNFFPNNIQAI